MTKPVLLLLTLALTIPAFAQTTLPPSGETIDVSIVNVDVFVTDRKGQRVTGLTADDFEIREEGRTQPITNFAEYRADTVEEHSTAPTAKRTILIFVERFSLPRYRTDPLFASLRKTVREVVRPGDSAAVVFWDNIAAYTLQNFTDELPKLEAALDEIEMQSRVSTMRSGLTRSREFARDYFASLPPETAARMHAANVWDVQEGAWFSLSRIGRKAEELQSLMRSMSDETGRKIVLFATNDFGICAVPHPSLGSPHGGEGNFSSERYREAVARTANEHGITIYPVYPLGLEWTPHNSADIGYTRQPLHGGLSDLDVLVNQTGALDELARETGGLMAAGGPDIVELLPRIAEDLSTYYSIAYRTPATGTTKSRDISVRTKNRNYLVRARSEYVEKTDFTRMRDRVIANLYQPEGAGAVKIHVEVDAIAKTGRNRWQVPVRVTIPIDALSMTDGTGAFSVFIASGGLLGVMSDVKQQRRTFVAADFTEDQEHFTYEFPVEFDSATSILSVGVMDERSKDFGLKTVDLPSYRAERRLGGE